jgi:hypothetical protein
MEQIASLVGDFVGAALNFVRPATLANGRTSLRCATLVLRARRLGHVALPHARVAYRMSFRSSSSFTQIQSSSTIAYQAESRTESARADHRAMDVRMATKLQTYPIELHDLKLGSRVGHGAVRAQPDLTRLEPATLERPCSGLRCSDYPVRFCRVPARPCHAMVERDDLRLPVHLPLSVPFPLCAHVPDSRLGRAGASGLQAAGRR